MVQNNREIVNERISERIRGIVGDTIHEIIREYNLIIRMPELLRLARKLTKYTVELGATYSPRPDTAVYLIQTSAEIYALAYMCKFQHNCELPLSSIISKFTTLPLLPPEFFSSVITYVEYNEDLAKLGLTSSDIESTICTYLYQIIEFHIKRAMNIDFEAVGELAVELINIILDYPEVLSSLTVSEKTIQRFRSRLGQIYGYYMYVIAVYCKKAGIKRIIDLLMSNDYVKTYVLAFNEDNYNKLMEMLSK